ncbi:Tad domain-containing protein [Altererythrobacter arenosus]|uniref:Tad domain-containing protein n=1 Tax=Altererythrobacter arenosus TaxID=3032592 RepID=A0ABY8FU14_9SPHN|nr:Tad domain-containing protein [Altererythrobacter sp. CAU 1644]WFL76611.1 Tad domain-containing protein [Altererythrobacter sp. CAU 1644]
MAMRNKLIRICRNLRKDLNGNVLIIAAIGAASTVGAAGIGVDTVEWYLSKRQLQQAADSGALAGAMNLFRGQDITSAATGEVDRNYVDGFNIVRIVNPPQEGDWTGDGGAVEVVVSASRALPFSGIFLENAPTIQVRSVAATVAVGEPCVIATATDGIGIDVFGSAIADLDCPVASNSPDGVSVDLGGSSFLDTDLIMSVGGVDYGSSNIAADTAVVSYGLPVEDPLASRGLTPPSSPSGCTANNFNVSPSQTVTISPGRYCNGMDIKGTVTMNPGVYIIDRGAFKINSQADVVGHGVTIILTGNSSSNVAELQINAGADLDLRAQTLAEATTTGDDNWAGILFYQDELGDGTQHTINGGADINMEGIIYMPTADLTYNGNASQTAQCLLLITERVRFGGTNRIANNCNDEIDDIDTSARIIRVVE